MRQLSISILLSVVIFTILTIPHITLFMCGVGISYPTMLIILCGLASSVLSTMLSKSKYFQ